MQNQTITPWLGIPRLLGSISACSHEEKSRTAEIPTPQNINHREQNTYAYALAA